MTDAPGWDRQAGKVFDPVFDPVSGPVFGPVFDPVFDPVSGPVFDPVFDTVAAEYDAHRPAYPDDLIDRACAELVAGAEVLEVGCGTGQLTGSLVARGLRVLLQHLVQADRCCSFPLRAVQPYVNPD